MRVPAKYLIPVLILGGVVGVRMADRQGITEAEVNQSVLGENTVREQIYFTVNVPAIFKQDITAPNVVYSVNGETGDITIDNTLKAGEGIKVEGRTISSTGILTLAAGTGISIDGNKITSTITQGLTSLSAGTGISVSGSEITNSDKGSSQNIFKTISVSGQESIAADNNTDILSLVGSGLSITTDATLDKITLTVDAPDFTQSGWTDNGTTINLTTLTDAVEVGALTASSLVVNGITVLDGNVTVGNGVSVLPNTDLGSDLGSSSYRFNNLWVANINSNSSQSFSGQTTFSYAPTDTTITQASVLINPTTSAANGQLLGLSIAGYQRALIDEDGDITLGYSDATSAPASDYPLNIYGHSGTRVASIDTSGNLVMGESLTTSGDLAVNTDKLFIESTNGNIGIGTATPTSKLSVIGDITAAIATGVEGFKLTDTSDNTKLAYSWTGTGLSMDIPALSSTNLLTNGTFETDITTGGWSQYSLNDQFTTDLSAGSVNGTSAEPTGGTRTVVDTNSKLSITNSQLSFATGGVTNGNPGIWYDGISRNAGKILIQKVNVSSHEIKLGWKLASTNVVDIHGYRVRALDSTIYAMIYGAQTAVGTIAGSTDYLVATILRSTGAYYYIKGGTYSNWTLLYVDSTRSEATLYPGIGASTTTDDVATADNIRIPTSTWLPTPLAYDTFTRSDGAIGTSETTGPDSQTTPALSWTGGAITGEKLVITPSIGDELVTNGDFSSDEPPGNAWTRGPGWTVSGGVLSASAATGGTTQVVSGPSGWYQGTYDVVSPYNVWYYLNGNVARSYTAAGSKIVIARTTENPSVGLNTYSVDVTGTFDNLSLKFLTPSSLFSSVSTNTSDVIASTDVNLSTSGSSGSVTPAGIITNLDDADNPANFVIAYHDGKNVKLEKNVAGTYTTVRSTTVAYVAGATLRVIKDGTKYRVYYNNALVGAEDTISDAGIISNTKHGLFSTYSGNSFDNFTLFARGTGNEYVNLPDTDLTATRDTAIHYSGDSSLKLVASTSDNGYTQSYTLPNTSNYTLSAFVYTDGSAVTSADVALENGDVNLATTYTSVGNGWYKLSASFAGVASARNYGVRVKAGKTVYVDNLSLYASTASSVSTLSLGNSTTGLGGLSVEATTTLNSGLSTLQALIIKGSSGQTEDLTEWQNSTGTVLAAMTSNGYLVTPQVNAIDSNGLKLYDDGGNGIFIEDGGNVGIGTTNPSYKLDITGTLNATGATTLGSTLDVSGLTTITGTSGTNALQINRSGAEVLGLSTGTNYANLNLSDSSTEPTNLLTNPSFDTNLTSWSEVPSYTLNDQFTTDLSAGSVNGTQAEPTGGTRTVTDTNNKLSISGSAMTLSGGASSLAYGDPGVLYPTITRQAGTVLMSSSNFSNITTNTMGFGWSDGTDKAFNGTGNLTGINISGGHLKIKPYAGALMIYQLSTISDNIAYNFSVIQRSTGDYYFIKGGVFANWTLMWISNAGSANLKPFYGNYNVSGTADNIRIPTSTWLPTPLAYDTFTRGDGAIGSSETTGPDSQTTPSLTWTGGAISTNKNVITPTLGSELLIDPGLENWTNSTTPTNWTTVIGGTSTINQEASTINSGSYAARMDVDSSTNLSYLKQTVTSPANTWYSVSLYSKASSALGAGAMQGQFSTGGLYIGGALTTTYTQQIVTGRSSTANPTYQVRNGGGSASKSIYLDDFSIKPLTLSSLFSSVSTSDSDVIADAGVTLTAGTQAGLVLNLDSTSSPANFVIAYHDGSNVKLEKSVNGSYTTVRSTAVSYVAGATLRVIKDGTKYRVYYNNALVGAEDTISDAGIISNTKHGLFSTYSGNSFDNFTLFARGTGAEYTSAPFEELTATAETTTTYNNSAGSVQLVAGGTDGNYLQSVNVGDTSTYTLIAYAYTDGTAVTSADVELYYDTDTITTTYTPMGGTGWYRLSGTVTGEASAKDYGVRVKAGQTVYVDELKVQAGTASNQTLYVTNTGTGVTGLSVQGSVNATLNGVATLVKAGAISDADFSDTVRDGLFGFDTTNHRLYFREGGSWSYIARTAGFQIPKEEVAGLSGGDYLLPYVESFMSDGAVHGMYQKFDLNKLLSTQGAVEFTTAPSFPASMGGTAVISAFSSQVEVKFAEAYPTPPVVNISLVMPDEDQTFVEEGQKAFVSKVTTEGFSIILPTLAIRDFTYQWTAINVGEAVVTRSESLVPGPEPEEASGSGGW